MALGRKQATTIALEPKMNAALSRAAKARGVSRSEFVRQQLSLVLEQWMDHPKPRSAGISRRRPTERGDEDALFKELER
jgi:Arc/MetJ-type ribon-helix-helix transcriptional regulator